MNTKPIITVFGATGAQGGSLIQAMLADPDRPFTPRAITRNPDSEKGRALAAQGVEVVGADADDPASLGAALAGAHGAYIVTNFWEHFSPEREQTQVRNMAEAAKAAGVQHAIWSTLEDTRNWVPLEDDRMPTLQGKYKVPHFDAKGESNAVFTELGVPTTFLQTSFYWDNLIHFGAGPAPAPDGTLALTLPIGTAKMSGIAVEDIGKVAYAIFKRGPEYIGKTVSIAGEHLTGAEMAAALTTALGQQVHYNAVEPAVYREFGFPGADDMGNMYQFYRDFSDYFVGVRDLAATRALNPELQTFAQWLDRHASEIPIAEAPAAS